MLAWTNELVAFARNLDREQLGARLREAAEGLQVVAVVIAGYKLVPLVRSLATSFGALNVALLANPWGLAAAGITVLGVAVQQGLSRIRALNRGLTETAERARVLGDRTCNGGAYTFQIPGPLAVQDSVAIPMKVQDAASIRCVYAYLQHLGREAG